MQPLEASLTRTPCASCLLSSHPLPTLQTARRRGPYIDRPDNTVYATMTIPGVTDSSLEAAVASSNAMPPPAYSPSPPDSPREPPVDGDAVATVVLAASGLLERLSFTLNPYNPGAAVWIDAVKLAAVSCARIVASLRSGNIFEAAPAAQLAKQAASHLQLVLQSLETPADIPTGGRGASVRKTVTTYMVKLRGCLQRVLALLPVSHLTPQPSIDPESPSPYKSVANEESSPPVVSEDSQRKLQELIDSQDQAGRAGKRAPREAEHHKGSQAYWGLLEGGRLHHDLLEACRDIADCVDDGDYAEAAVLAHEMSDEAFTAAALYDAVCSTWEDDTSSIVLQTQKLARSRGLEGSAPRSLRHPPVVQVVRSPSCR